LSKKISIFRSAEGEAKYYVAYEASLKLWPVPFEALEVSTRYGKTHINACGPRDAFPLLLLHGGYVSSTMWFPNIADLSTEFRVLALDTIGEPGKSIPTQPNASPGDLAAWLEGVLDELGISKTNVVGLSRGGWLGLNFALHAPQRLERIALLSPAASFISLNSFFRAVSGAAMHIPFRVVLKAALYSWVARGFVLNDIFTEQFILAFQNWNWETATKGYSGVMPSVFDDGALRQLHLPILLLIGDQDKLNPPRAIERARQILPQVEAEIIPKAGHLLSMEQPESVDARLLRFFCRS
jgi:pimeloyl-ACP methyl ester carboxylesterase